MGFGKDTSVLGQRGKDQQELRDPVQALLAVLETEAHSEYLGEDAGERGGGPAGRADSARQDGLPDWFDEKRFKRGAETFERNIFLMFSGKMSGLLTLLAVPSIVKVLVETTQSGEPSKAFRRYVDTIRHMLFWYRTSITDPNSPCRESLAAVRSHHRRGSRFARRAGLAGISQLDMVVTQFAFCGFAVLRRKRLHVDASDQELLDFIHVWRTIGSLLGIPDRYNICQFDTDIHHTEAVLEGVCVRWLKPALLSPPEEFESMSRALINGCWCMMPVLEYDSYLHFTQEMAGIKPESCHQPNSMHGSAMLALLRLVPHSLSWPLLGPLLRAYHNANMRFSIYMSTYYPLLAWYSFPGNSSTRFQKLVPSET